MPTTSIPFSPLLPHTNSVKIFYREFGSGTPLIILHGGWGYEIYSFKNQIETLAANYRIVVPDRSGYGRSSRIDTLPVDFHQRAATETLMVLDSLEIDRAIFWGHSDGAVIAALIGLAQPQRCLALILEAFHFYRVKESSREFFEQMSGDPEGLGQRVVTKLADEHGHDYWCHLLLANGNAWLEINRQSTDRRQDLYDGRLSELSIPTIFIHGERDPRTEPDEMQAIKNELPNVSVHLIENAGHSPHSERDSAQVCTGLASSFLDSIFSTRER
jgi:pimeloyl-ACP methyl ester carboxylesterase